MSLTVIARLVLLISVSVLTGCSSTRLLVAAEQNMLRSEFEQAMAQYAEASKRFPADTQVRIAAARAKSEAIGRLTATAVTLRQSGRLTDAELVIRRALAMDPTSERAKAVRTDIERDIQSMTVVNRANQFVAGGDKSGAFQAVEAGLRENPGHQELAALQRRLASEQRLGIEQTTKLASGQPLSLQFRDANLKLVLEALARFSDINFVLDRDVRPDLRVTIFIRDAPLADALEVLATTNQLAIKVIDSNTALLYPNTPEKQREYQELVVRAFYLSNADARQTAAMLRSVLKLREVFVDEKLNFLVLREPPEAIRLAERLVNLHDAGDAEVLLDVEVLEIQRQRLLELGVRFPDTFSLTPLSAGGGTTQLTVDDLRNLNSSRVAVGVPPVVVNLRREVGDANVLANPKIRVRNREKARVLIGDRVPVVTSTATASGFVSENIQYLDVGLKLEVEPQVFMGDDIAIKVGLEVSSLSREITTRSGSLAYQIGTRNASTALRLRDGETQLLAGLISTEDRAAANRVPGLGDLPVLGRLFSSQLDRSNRSEIVLSITPRLVRGTGRPDFGDLEFSSGTEAALRVRSPVTTGVRVQSPERRTAQAGALPTPGSEVPQSATAAATQSSAAVSSPVTASFASQSASLEPPRMMLTSPRRVARDSTFVVSVVLSTGFLSRGAPVLLSFDAAHLELVGVEEGAFYRQGNAQTTLSHESRSGTGMVSATVIRSSADGANGADSILNLTFRAIAEGGARVQLSQASLIAVDGAIPTVQLPNALTVEIR